MSFSYSPIKPKIRPLTRRAPQKETMSFRIAALDLETGGLRGEPVVLAQLYHEQWSQPRVYNTCEEMLTDLFSQPKKALQKTVWYAHKAEFDWRYLIKPMKELFGDQYFMVPCERCEGTIYEIKILSMTEFTAKGDNVLITTFRDSFALFNQKLAKFTASFAKEHIKQDIGLDQGVLFDRENPVHIEYAKNDVLSLVVALKSFDKMVYKNYGVHIKGTTASTAFAAWQTTIPEGEYHNRVSQDAEVFIRKCYFGGLVQLNAKARTLLNSVVTFDRNSSYPACMRFGIPFGPARFTFKHMEGKPGFYRVTAHVPQDMVLSIVPHRNEDGQVCWPTGKFETFMSTIEIEYMTTRGARFDIHEGYYFDGISKCFDTFVDKCETLRKQAKRAGDLALETVVKLMQNSVYGRFGMKPEGKECVLSFDGIPDGFAPGIDEESGEISDIFFYKSIKRNTNYMLPHYAAWITANARIELDKDTEALGRHLCRYRDTDSASIEAEAITCDRVGEDYGQLKDEGQKILVQYLGLKNYNWVVPKTSKLDGRMKGIPERQKTQDFLAAARDGTAKPVEYLSVSSLQSFLKSDIMASDRTRAISQPENSYSYYIDKDGWFRPRHFEG